MASRVRQVAATPGPSSTPRGAAPTPRGPTTATYEPPAYTLNPAGQRALAELTRKYNLQKLNSKYTEAQELVSVSAAEINERVADKSSEIRKRKARQATQGQDGEDDIEDGLEELKERVEKMTKRMDESMQKLIDGRHYVEGMQEALTLAAQEARASASTQASTQNARSQPRRRRAMSGGASDFSDAEEDEAEYQDFDPTAPRDGTQAVKSTSAAFTEKLEEKKLEYQNYSKRQRYASNNEYKGFKQVVHDAMYPDQEVELPHESAWFNEPGQAPAPGETAGGDAEEDEDDDIQIQRATTSTKCPLTLQEFKDPLTSTKCKHSFEASAILEMLSASVERENGRSGPQVVRCPVASCDVRFSKSDLVKDAALIRRIKRLQHAKRIEENDEDDESHGANRMLIEDDAVDVDDFEAGPAPTRAVKGETKPTPRSEMVPSTQQPRSTGVVDLGDDTDEGEDEPMEDDMYDED
ncbi:hypothetical protein B0A48_10558 [Cryoendolithus antarcticus]|uniref:SP-RING-type domain-containing protein n=1 Tax=Cryoendolithus antarcticus TaxID=1507870 RepID=A0A1V8SXN0_9PEZI|nr:hypothetical protein B0A48_10558 [Cryoendolithus antarcticus]